MSTIRIHDANASRVTRMSECEMRLTWSGSLGAGHGRLCAGGPPFLTRGKQAR